MERREGLALDLDLDWAMPTSRPMSAEIEMTVGISMTNMMRERIRMMAAVETSTKKLRKVVEVASGGGGGGYEY